MDIYKTDNLQSFLFLLQETKPKYVTLKDTLDADAWNYHHNRGSLHIEASFRGKHEDTSFRCEYIYNRPLRASIEGKKELIEELCKLGVAQEELDRLKKISVKSFYGMSANTVSEDEEEVVITKKELSDKFTFNAGRVVVKVKADTSRSVNSPLRCELTMDYTEERKHILDVLRLGVPEGTTVLEGMDLCHSN